jgi:hypothetical protein
MTIEFVEVPPGRTGLRSPLASDPVMRDFTKALRANPERWAKYPRVLTPEQARSVSYRIKAGRKPGTPAMFLPDSKGSFQAVARNGVVYVQFVPARKPRNRRAQ